MYIGQNYNSGINYDTGNQYNLPNKTDYGKFMDRISTAMSLEIKAMGNGNDIKITQADQDAINREIAGQAVRWPNTTTENNSAVIAEGSSALLTIQYQIGLDQNMIADLKNIKSGQDSSVDTVFKLMTGGA